MNPIPFSMLNTEDQTDILIVYSDSEFTQQEVRAGLYIRFPDPEDGMLVMVEPNEVH